MNVLTFDIEEWFIEKHYQGDHSERYQAFDRYLKSILELLDECNFQATFFCVGSLAREFPEVVKTIADKGHEIGCHSDTHMWLNGMDRKKLEVDTGNAIKSIEDVIGGKVLSYRAPAFSIGENNRWAFEVLAECGIERDASIFPANRDFGGFPSVNIDLPCMLKFGSTSIKEFPISLTSIGGKRMAYSGGGYFRMLPQRYIVNTMSRSEYVMAYFHIGDLIKTRFYLDSKEGYESYFKQPASLKNRVTRMIKRSLGTGHAFEKMCDIVRTFDFVNLNAADRSIDWSRRQVVEL